MLGKSLEPALVPSAMQHDRLAGAAHAIEKPAISPSGQAG
jgi:hypothetical protein